MSSSVTTTHFDFHSALEGRLLKLDLLGHDVPTIIRMLHDFTGIDPRTVDLGDKDVLSLFQSPAALGVSAEDISCKTGTLGLPEFGTAFVRKMLTDAKPKAFADLVRISGMSHGTGVWLGNADELIKSGVCALEQAISTRDDIMRYLISMGVEKKTSFKIMESVRKGRGVTDEEARTMAEAGVPDWYAQSCRRIDYMFPKGHAVAYVMMAARIAWYKIHYPAAFYAALFSAWAADFDYATMCRGKAAAKAEKERVKALGDAATAKDESRIAALELVLEFYARGLKFLPIDLYESPAGKFAVRGDSLRPPLISMQGLGETVAEAICLAREEGEFFSVEEFRERTKANKNVVDLLRETRALEGIPETAQLTLY
jgi:DNA polymerase-3 subunit alpha (Gram-positive type)